MRIKCTLILLFCLSLGKVSADTITNWQIYKDSELILAGNVISESAMLPTSTLDFNDDFKYLTIDFNYDFYASDIERKIVFFYDKVEVGVFNIKGEANESIKLPKAFIESNLKEHFNKQLIIKYFDDNFIHSGISIGMFIINQNSKLSIETKRTDKDYYNSISFLSQGKIKWYDDLINEIEGEAFRFVITSSSIYNKIYIEKITYGLEGCCRRVDSKKEIPMDKIFKTFNINGERSGVKFIKWISPTSIEISIYEVNYLIENINMDKVLISKL